MTLLIAVVSRYCRICRASLTLRKWDFDIGFVQFRVRMLFYHVREKRLELKRQRVTDFFPPPLCFCDSILRSSLVDTGSLPIVGGSQKASRWNSNGMEAVFRTFWQKRLSVVNNGSMGRRERGDAARPRCTAMIFLSARFAICQEMDVNRYHGPGEKYRNLVENLRRRP